MSFNSWIGSEVKTVLREEIPELATMTLSEYIDARLAAAIETTTPVLVKALVEALLGPMATKIESLAASIPGATAGLLTNEINQLPQQVDALLNIPAAIAAGVAGLPQAIVNDIRGILPFGEEKK